jgi:hypothetical protein
MSKTTDTSLPAAGGAGEVTAEQLMDALLSATEDQRAEVLGLLGAPTPAKKAVAGNNKKTAIPAARKAAAAAPLPEPDEDGAPSAESYRLKEEDIDHAVCVGRILKDGKDRRWAPAVYREFQCGKATEEDCDLCKVCQNRLEKYAEDPKPADWTGRVTEEPPCWVHMLGTEWAETKKPKWLGVASTDSGSETSSTASSRASKAAEKEAAKRAKEEEKAAKAAEKEAAKAAKEAEKAAKAAEKEAAKKAKAAEKEAAKAAKGTKAKKAVAAAPALAVEELPAPAARPAEAAPAADLAAAISTLVAALSGDGKTVKITIELSS